MTDLAVTFFLFGTVSFCVFLSCKLLSFIERPLTINGVIAPLHHEEKELQDEIPELRRLWDKYLHLLQQITRQDWQKGKALRPAEPIRAICYRFIVPWLWKKKLRKCEKYKKDYDLLLKMHRIHEEDSFVVHR